MYQVRISENAEEELRGFLAFLRAEPPSSTRPAEWFDHLQRGLYLQQAVDLWDALHSEAAEAIEEIEPAAV